MSTKRTALIFLVASVMLLTAGIGPQQPEAAFALALSPSGGTIPYPGRLTDATGRPVVDGAYDFTFALYAAEADGEPLWSEAQKGIVVKGGMFVASLGSANPIPEALSDGEASWLAVSVRGSDEVAFTDLAPRQRVSTTLAATSTRAAAGSTCAHTHFGESWSGSTGLWGLYVNTPNSNLSGALFGRTYGIGSGVYGDANGSTSVNVGVLGTSNSSIGFGGKFANTGGGKALYAENDSGGIALYAEGNGGGSTNAALRVRNTNLSNGIAAYMASSSSYPTLEIDKVNPGGAAIDLQLFNTGNANPSHYIAAYDDHSPPQLQVLVASSGVIAAKGYITWNADVAEMLPAVAGLQPGEVLVIGMDGKLTRSSEPYQTTVVGVYSTAPGFVGGQPIEGKVPGTIPLAVTGIVPVKVASENGAIRPGDLLVASSTAGHAMKAGPNPPQGSVIGKALEPLTGNTGVIKMLATLQ